MRQTVRKLLLLLFFSLSFLLVFHARAFAGDPPVITTDPDTGAVANEKTKTVHVVFPGLVNGKEYAYCLKNSADDCFVTGPIGPIKSITAKNNQLEFSVCADGDNALKLANGNSCTSKDFFHGGHVYHVRIFNSDALNYFSHFSFGPFGNSKPSIISNGDAAIAVSYYNPTITIKAVDKNTHAEKTSPALGDTVRVTISGTRSGGEDNNDYKIELKDSAKDSSADPIETQCIVAKDNGTTVDFKTKLDNGAYDVVVGEQTREHEDGSGHVLEGGTCDGGAHIYASVHFNVTATGGKIDDIKTDPTGQDSQNASSAASTNSGADLAQAYQGAPSPTIPCLPEAAREGNCDKYPSAIGDIDTTPAGFIKAAFSLVLGLAGGIAVILIIIAGYQFMTSQGNPERIQAARERLISAIVGLVFIIFSVVILQVIGVDLLHLPGFGNQSVSTTGSAAPASGTSNCIVNGCSDISSYCLPPNPGMCVSPHTVPEGATCHDVHVNRDIDQACDPGLTCQSGKCEPTSQP